MKRIFSAIVIVLIICLMLLPATASSASTLYSDSDRNVSFTVPDGWSRYSAGEQGSTKGCWVDETYHTFFFYSVVDIYGQLSEENRSKVTRSEADNSIFTIDDLEKEFRNMDGISNLVGEKASFAGYSFFKFTYDITEGSSTEKLVLLIHIYDGYEFIFKYDTLNSSVDEAVVNAFMDTVNFAGETSSNRVQTDTEKAVKDAGKRVGSRVLSRIIIFGIIALIGGGAGIFGSKKSKAKKAAANTAAGGQGDVYYTPGGTQGTQDYTLHNTPASGTNSQPQSNPYQQPAAPQQNTDYNNPYYNPPQDNNGF